LHYLRAFLTNNKSKKMDTDKWKSVLVPRKIYDEMKLICRTEGRTITNQLQLMWRVYRDSEFHKKNDDVDQLRKAGL